MALNPINDVIERISRGEIVIVVDDEDRENEGDFVMAAEFCTPEAVNFMITHGRGLVCMPCSPAMLTKLGIEPMLTGDMVTVDTPFCVPIDHKGGTSGISAQDRALTVLSCTRDDVSPEDFHRPGHIFPLRASEDGVLARRGHTEATIDLARLAGCAPIGMLCEILNEDGTAARMDDLELIAKKHDLAITSIELLAQYREENDNKIIDLDSVKDAEQVLQGAASNA